MYYFMNSLLNFSLDMSWYPFDIQQCHLTFTMNSDSVKFVKLLPGYLNYTGPKELTQYFVKKTQIFYDELDGLERIVIEIILGRRILSIFLTIFLTTFLLNFVGHSAIYFKSFYFEATITVNLTLMLVLVTMYTSVSLILYIEKDDWIGS